jgi:hypothetical protein
MIVSPQSFGDILVHHPHRFGLQRTLFQAQEGSSEG